MRTVYREGDVIALPAGEDRIGLGLVARVGQRGVLLGYFFPYPYRDLPGLDEIPHLDCNSAVFVTRFGDLGLLEGRWKVIGQLPGWNRADWPVPNFVRHASLSGRSYRVIYGDDFSERPTEILAAIEEVVGLPEDSLSGDMSVESRLAEHLQQIN